MMKSVGNIMERDRFHRAARDGYLDLLRDATRKDTNEPDDDGMTPTLWAAYYGHLEALRTLVGRGGDPDKCDHSGNTALHWAVANGHMNCVSFLINFEVNIWSLNNDFHSAKDLAGNKQLDNNGILDLMDNVVAKQSALHPKAVQKAKEKCLNDAEKRVRHYDKLYKKAARKAELEEKTIEKNTKKKMINGTIQRDSMLMLFESNKNKAHCPSMKFSDIVNSNSNGTMTSCTSKIRGFGAVSRKVRSRKVNNNNNNSLSDFQSSESLSDFKVRDKSSDTLTSKATVRSLTGLRRDSEILYVRKNYSNTTTHSLYESAFGEKSMAAFNVRHPHMRDVFSGNDDAVSTCTMKIRRAKLKDSKSNLTRTTSEPDFSSLLLRSDSGIGGDVILHHAPEASIFERPGFGSMAFRHSVAAPVAIKDLTSLSSVPIIAKKATGSGSAGSDSIGSAGSLAQRNATLSIRSGRSTPWEEDDPLLEDIADDIDDNDRKEMDFRDNGHIVQEDSEATNKLPRVEETTSPMLLFLVAHGLAEYESLFDEEKIDLDAIILLTEDDLKGLGLPLGPRRKLLSAIEKRRTRLREPGLLFDSDL
ncbi:Usher syndrome type-1G protein [Halotydeus destructor]|nr:Usher syndrome type-1G protein [Halotydeus destructor]